MLSDHDVFERRHGREQAYILEGSGDTGLEDKVRTHAEDAAPGEGNRALAGLVDARNDVEDRRLSGTVGADEAYDLPWPDVEADIGQGLKPSKIYTNVNESKVGLGSHKPVFHR